MANLRDYDLARSRAAGFRSHELEARALEQEALARQMAAGLRAWAWAQLEGHAYSCQGTCLACRRADAIVARLGTSARPRE